MPSSPFLAYLLTRINNYSSESELQELLLVTAAFVECKQKVCAYCKWYGHYTWQCPVDSEIAVRCSRDPACDKIRSQVTIGVRVAHHTSLRSILGKRKVPDFR